MRHAISVVLVAVVAARCGSSPVAPDSVETCAAFGEWQASAIHGVQAAATGTPLPLQGHEMTVAFDIEAQPAAISDRPRSDFAIVSPGYFAAMGIPVLSGRDFTQRDDATALPVLVVNQAFARRYSPGQNAIGQRIRLGVGPPPALDLSADHGRLRGFVTAPHGDR